MAITTESGEAVNVEALNEDFARSQLGLSTEPTAPPPPKRVKTPSAPGPAPQRKPRKPKDEKTLVGPSTPALAKKRAEAGADILHQFAVMAEVAHATTGNEAWHKDAEILVEAAPTFGEACAQLAEKSPAFAKYLDSEGTTAGAYIGFGLVTAQIGMAVIDNHGARNKIPQAFKKAVWYTKAATKKLFRGKKK